MTAQQLEQFEQCPVCFQCHEGAGRVCYVLTLCSGCERMHCPKCSCPQEDPLPDPCEHWPGRAGGPRVLYWYKCSGPRGCGAEFAVNRSGQQAGTQRCVTDGCNSGCFEVTAFYPDPKKLVRALEDRLAKLRLVVLHSENIGKARKDMEKLYDAWEKEEEWTPNQNAKSKTAKP